MSAPVQKSKGRSPSGGSLQSKLVDLAMSSGERECRSRYDQRRGKGPERNWDGGDRSSSKRPRFPGRLRMDVYSGTRQSRREIPFRARNRELDTVIKQARDDERTSAFWNRKILKEEEKDKQKWGHSGFKEMYKKDLKRRRSSSTDSSPERPRRGLKRKRNKSWSRSSSRGPSPLTKRNVTRDVKKLRQDSVSKNVRSSKRRGSKTSSHSSSSSSSQAKVNLKRKRKWKKLRHDVSSSSDSSSTSSSNESIRLDKKDNEAGKSKSLKITSGNSSISSWASLLNENVNMSASSLAEMSKSSEEPKDNTSGEIKDVADSETGNASVSKTDDKLYSDLSSGSDLDLEEPKTAKPIVKPQQNLEASRRMEHSSRKKPHYSRGWNQNQYLGNFSKLPRNWSDPRVRYSYYRDQGYYKNQHCSFQEFIQWEEWWYKYRDWLGETGYFNPGNGLEWQQNYWDYKPYTPSSCYKPRW